MIYTIKAWWPNVIEQPVIKRAAHLADALELAVALMCSHKHTTISVTTPDALEIIRLWGQPMPNGDDWP